MELYDHIEISGHDAKHKLSYEDLTNKKKLILIQAPRDFDIESLTGQKVILEGHQNLPADENNVQGKRYELKSTMNCHKNMKMYNVIVPSFDTRKYCIAKQIRGSVVINQTVKIPPVHLPEKEEVLLPQIPEKSLHTWVPFGTGDPVKVKKIKSRKRRRIEASQSKTEVSFEILSSTAESFEDKDQSKKKKKKKKKSKVTTI